MEWLDIMHINYFKCAVQVFILTNYGKVAYYLGEKNDTQIF